MNPDPQIRIGVNESESYLKLFFFYKIMLSQQLFFFYYYFITRVKNNSNKNLQLPERKIKYSIENFLRFFLLIEHLTMFDYLFSSHPRDYSFTQLNSNY